MGNLEIRRIDDQLVIEQNVDVDGTITIAFALMVTTEFALYLLGDLEYLTRQECRFTINSAIKEHIA